MLYITNARIASMAGQWLKHGEILIDGGIISDIGEELNYTSKRTDDIINADGALVFPGFIDAHTCLGVMSQDTQASPLLTLPLNAAANAIKVDDIAFGECVSAGITAVIAEPNCNTAVCGRCALINTAQTHRQADFQSKNTQILNPDVALKLSLDADISNPALTLSTISGELFTAQSYTNIRNSENNIFGVKNPALEAYMPILDGAISAYVQVSDIEGVRLGLRLYKQFGIRLVFVGCENCLEADDSLIDELREASAEFVIGSCLANGASGFIFAKKLFDEGFAVALSTAHPHTGAQYLPTIAALAVRDGISMENALRSITVNAARIAGAENMLGSLTKGAQGDVVIYESNPLDSFAKPIFTIVNGRIEYRA